MHKLSKILKKIKHPNLKQLFFLLSLVIITTIFSFQGYLDASRIPRYQSPMKRSINDVNTALGYYNNLQYAINNNLKSDLVDLSIIYDHTETPVLPEENHCYFDVADNSENNVISLKGITPDILEYISNDLEVLTRNNEPIMITFNYDAIKKDRTIIVDEISHLQLNDRIYMNNPYEQLLTSRLNEMETPFAHYHYDNESTHALTLRLDEIAYLEKFFHKVKNDKLFDKDGYYEQINPQDNPIEPYPYVDENGQEQILKIRFCFQELSPKYTIEPSATADDLNTAGYLVWYEYAQDVYNYTFTDYLLEHYYIYLITAVILVFGLFLLRKQTVTIPVTESIPEPKNSEPLKRKITDPQKINLTALISEIIAGSQNILTFKKISLDFKSDVSFIYGNNEEITKLVNDLYFFMIQHSHQGDTIEIQLMPHGLSYTNYNLDLSNENFNELSICREIIEAHGFKHHFEHHTISFCKDQ